MPRPKRSRSFKAERVDALDLIDYAHSGRQSYTPDFRKFSFGRRKTKCRGCGGEIDISYLFCYHCWMELPESHRRDLRVGDRYAAIQNAVRYLEIRERLKQLAAEGKAK